MEDVKKVLDQTYRWSSDRNFKGYNKHDGLNSPVLRFFSLGMKWLRIIAIQAIMRFPVNLRPLFFVSKSYNPKGLSLFVLGLLDRYQSEQKSEYLKEAKELLDLLQTLQSSGEWGGKCWGYQYPWQDPFFYAPTGTPNAVVTAFVCEAFLKAYHLTQDKQYLDVVESAVGFFLNDLPVLKDEKNELCIGYMPVEMEARVMDVSILIGSVISQVAALNGDAELRSTAIRLVTYVVNQQTEEGAWFYTDPPNASRIKHDNYHTGFILDALERFMSATNDRSYQSVYDRGLKFYAEKLFNDDGSPRWMSDVDFPHDIHGAAQGIITFSRHMDSYAGLAEKIYQWTIDHLYHPDGRFYYQKTRYFTKRFTLMRWCNAWSFRAIACYLNALESKNRKI